MTSQLPGWLWRGEGDRRQETGGGAQASFPDIQDQKIP